MTIGQEYALTVLESLHVADLRDIADGVEGPGEALPEVCLIAGGASPVWIIKMAQAALDVGHMAGLSLR